MAHALQGLTEIDPRATVTSSDGISAYDLISRQAMLEGLREMPGGASILPFVSMFYGGPSSYLWEDALGRVHTIVQGEGGEQGDALMPLLFSYESWIQCRWCGGSNDLPVCQRGIKVLGTPSGQVEFIRAHLDLKTAEHQVLLDRIPLLENTQAAWLLVVHCAGARANYIARVVEPGTAEDFCRAHDERLWRCLCAIMQVSPVQPAETTEATSMPLVWCWVDWGCALPEGSADRQIGQAGLTHWRSSGQGILTWRLG